MQAMASTVKRTTTPDEVALLLHQVSLPAARRDYELRSSSPAPRAPRAATSSSQLVSRAFQNARAMSFNATAHNKDVPFVAHNERVFFSGPLSSHGMAQHPAMGVRASAAGGDERRDNDTGSNVGSTSRDHACEQVHIPEARDRMVRAISASPVLGDASVREARIARTGEAPRRARSGDLRAAPKSSTSFNNKNRPRSSELSRELMRTSSSTWGREDAQTRNGGAMGARDVTGARDATRASEVTGARDVTRTRDVMGARDVARVCEEVPKVEEKKRGESRRRPTASIAWDSLNESQANSPQHELAAIPFKWEEAPGKPLAMRIREDSQLPTARLATPASRADAGPLSRVEELADVRAQSHRFYARVSSQCDLLPARKSSFDSASAHLISEVVSSIDLVAPAAAKFLVESWVSPNVAPEAHVAVPFQWEEAPGVPLKLDCDEEACISMKPIVPLQLPPRLASPAPAHPANSKEDMRGRLRTRSMSGPLAGYYPHASPARRRQLQHSPVPQRRSCSPSKRSISPSRIHAIAQHFSSHRKQTDRSHSVLTGSLEAELGDTGGTVGYGAGLGRSASGALLPEFGRSPRRYNLSPTRRSVSPSRRIQALAKQLTCKIRPAASKLPPNAIFAKSPQGDPWSPVNHPDELHLSGPSSSNSDMDASSQTPPSEVAFSKSLSRVSYESFEHSFAHRAAAATNSGSSPSRDEALLASPPPSSTDGSKTTRNSNANSNSNATSSPGSPYLGPSCEDGFKGQNNRKVGSPLGAAEGTVKAVVKMCRNGSSALRKKSTQQTSAHDLWAPTLASYFHCLEAATLISNPGGARTPAALTSSSSADPSPSPSATDSPLAPTRLPYTMPTTSSEQNLLWKDYCESPNSQLGATSCLGVKIAPASLFLSRGNNKRFPASETSSSVGWRDGGMNSNATEEGFRSPAYAATLELLSPSTEVFRKKKTKRHLGMGGSSGARGIKLVMPSTRRRSQIMEAVCTSLKRALYKCARRCRRKACSPPPLGSAPLR